MYFLNSDSNVDTIDFKSFLVEILKKELVRNPILYQEFNLKLDTILA